MATFAFFLLGLLIGNIAGLTEAAITLPLIAALFAFGGTSAIAWTAKIPDAERKLAVRSILGIAAGCLVGIYAGIVTRQHQLLGSPKIVAAIDTTNRTPIRTSPGYLRSNDWIRASALVERDLNRDLVDAKSPHDSIVAYERAFRALNGSPDGSK